MVAWSGLRISLLSSDLGSRLCFVLRIRCRVRLRIWGWGNVGWLPLGPCDHFHPWYGRYGGGYGAVGYNAYNHGGFAPLHGGTRFSNVNMAMHDTNFRGGTTVSGKEFGTGHMN